MPSIAEISADCGCTTLKWSDKDKALAVTFKAGKFPKHIVGAIQPFTKRIYVTFEDESVDILTLTGTKVSLKSILAYIQGNTREALYFSKYFQFLIRPHIREQIGYRLRVMNPVCYFEGACVECGCDTPALQMADKACKGGCYPAMMNKKDWEKFKKKDMENSKHWEVREIKLVNYRDW